MVDYKTIGEKNYEQFAKRYAALTATKPHNAYYDRPAVLSMLPDDMTGLRILDAGCGPGHYTAELRDRGAEVVAFDVTSSFVSIMKRRFHEDKSVTVFRHDIQRPFAFAQTGTFDYVVCALVLNYVEDWHAVYAEFARVLKSGGMCVVSHGHPMGDYMHMIRFATDKDEPLYLQTQKFVAE